MLAALEAADDDTLVWNWTGTVPARRASGPVAWRTRRSSTASTSNWRKALSQLMPIPKWRADTVTEFFELFYPRFETEILAAGLGGSMHLHATDVPGAEWTVDPRAGGSSITREHVKAGVALRGSAFELACWTWGRLPTERLEILGDGRIADRFQEVVRV